MDLEQNVTQCCDIFDNQSMAVIMTFVLMENVYSISNSAISIKSQAGSI